MKKQLSVDYWVVLSVNKTSAIKHCLWKCGKMIFDALYSSDLFIQFPKERFVNHKWVYIYPVSCKLNDIWLPN